MFNATFGEDQRSAFGDYLELANWRVMVARNPAFRQKAPDIRGGVWGEAPRFFLFFFIFFL